MCILSKGFVGCCGVAYPADPSEGLSDGGGFDDLALGSEVGMSDGTSSAGIALSGVVGLRLPDRVYGGKVPTWGFDG